jgi:hypothetical protein
MAVKIGRRASDRPAAAAFALAFSRRVPGLVPANLTPRTAGVYSNFQAKISHHLIQKHGRLTGTAMGLISGLRGWLHISVLNAND